jgi:photosystem II stability/assembly factor-like uncharacterized protein
MVNGAVGTAVGSQGIIQHTNTGGEYGWQLQNSGTLATLRAVAFTSLSVGIAVGDSGIIRTTDGGSSWHSSLISARLWGITFAQSDIAIAVGDNGVILRTTDAGETWLLQSSGVQSLLTAVHFLDANVGYAVGFSGVILKTTNGGSSWVVQPSGTTLAFWSVHFHDLERGIAGGGGPLGAGVVRWTTDGGQTWNPQTSGPILLRHYGVRMLNSTTAIAVGTHIRRSTDKGATWPDVDSIPRTLQAVSLINESIGTAVGWGMIIRTTNGGLTWTQQFMGSQARLYGVSQITPSTAIAVGEAGSIYRTTTGGVFVGVGTPPVEITTEFVLEQNYPNPFNPITTIQFTLLRSTFVKLTVYDILGAEVTTLLATELPSGPYTVRWDATGKPSGVYFYRLESNAFVETKKLMLLK